MSDLSLCDDELGHFVDSDPKRNTRMGGGGVTIRESWIMTPSRSLVAVVFSLYTCPVNGIQKDLLSPFDEITSVGKKGSFIYFNRYFRSWITVSKRLGDSGFRGFCRS